MSDAVARTMSAPVTTLEIDFHARRSPSSASRSTNTGINVAPATPPSTRSKSMFGTVLARLKESAIGVKPRTQANTSTRNKPVSDRFVPRTRIGLGPWLHPDRRLLQPRQHRAEHALRPGARGRRRRDIYSGVRGTTRARRRTTRVEIDLERGYRRAHCPRNCVAHRVVLRTVDN